MGDVYSALLKYEAQLKELKEQLDIIKTAYQPPLHDRKAAKNQQEVNMTTATSISWPGKKKRLC